MTQQSRTQQDEASGMVVRTTPQFQDVVLAVSDHEQHGPVMLGAHLMVDGSAYLMQTAIDSGQTLTALYLSPVDVANFQRLYGEYQGQRGQAAR